MWPVIMPDPAPAHSLDRGQGDPLISLGPHTTGLSSWALTQGPSKEVSHLEGSKSPGQGKRGQREDKS